jgi:hypothetical protein
MRVLLGRQFSSQLRGPGAEVHSAALAGGQTWHDSWAKSWRAVSTTHTSGLAPYSVEATRANPMPCVSQSDRPDMAPIANASAIG